MGFRRFLSCFRNRCGVVFIGLVIGFNRRRRIAFGILDLDGIGGLIYRLHRRSAPTLRKSNTALVWLKTADAQLQAITLLDIAVRFLKRAITHFAQVQQPFQAIVQSNEGSEVHHVCDRTFDLLAFMVTVHRIRPRIRQQTLATERNAVGLAIQAQHIHLNLVADLEYVARMIHAMPRQLCRVTVTSTTSSVLRSAFAASQSYCCKPWLIETMRLPSGSRGFMM